MKYAAIHFFLLFGFVYLFNSFSTFLVLVICRQHNSLKISEETETNELCIACFINTVNVRTIHSKSIGEVRINFIWL